MYTRRSILLSKSSTKYNITMYKTNNQCWNEVMQSVKDSNRRTKICIELFGQENLIGLSNEQKELFWWSLDLWKDDL